MVRQTGLPDAALEVVGNIGQAVLGQIDRPALLELIHSEAGRVIAADCFAIGLYDPGEKGLRFELLYDQGESRPPLVLHQAEGWGLAGRVFEQCTPFLYPDLAAVGLTDEALPVGREVRSWLGVPLLARQEALGVLLVQSDQAKAFGPSDQRLLEAIASQAAVAIVDLSQHHEHDRRIAQLSVLAEIGRALASALGLEQLLQTVYQQAGRVVDATNFYIALYDAQSNEVSFPLSIEKGKPVQWGSRQAGNGLTEHVLRSRAPLLIRDDVPGTLEQLGVAMIGPSAVSWLGVPLMVADRVLGVMAVQSYTTARLYDDQDVALFSTIAAHTAAAVESARLYQRARRQAEEMETLFTVGRILAASVEPETTWKAVFEAVRRVVPYKAIEACLYDTQREVLQAVMGGTPQELKRPLEESYTLGEGYTGWIAQHGKALRIADVQQELEVRPKYEGMAGVEMRSYLGVPMILGDRLVGTLEIADSQAGTYNEHHEELLLAVAAQAAATIERARLFAETHKRAEEMATLNELGRALAAHLSIDQVVDEAYRQASRLLDTTSFYVALYDAAKDEITFAIDVVDGRVRKPYSTRRSGRGMTEYIVRSRAPLLITDNVPERLQGIGIEQIGPEALSWLGVPLMVGDKVLGVMAVQSYKTPRLYGEHEKDLLTTIASQAAIALENASLYEEAQRALAEVREANERQRELLDMVREMSTPLVPIAEGVLVLPLVGTVDSRRAAQIMDVLLEGISNRQARVVILDITGVPVVDTSVANYLLQATRAVHLLGAECILVGITPEVAQTIVGLGVDLHSLATRSDLQSGVEYASRLLRRKRLG